MMVSNADASMPNTKVKPKIRNLLMRGANRKSRRNIQNEQAGEYNAKKCNAVQYSAAQCSAEPCY